MANTDGNGYTIGFATVMVFIVGGILAALATGLKPAIKENERFEKQQSILYAMGVNENLDEKGEDTGSVNFIPTDKVEEAYVNYIKESFVIQNGKILEGEDAFKTVSYTHLPSPRDQRGTRMPSSA